jgi:voltage-gated potassium channel
MLKYIAGDTKVTELAVYPYYYCVTATSVGYGDYSPSTTLGRMIGAFWLIPGAVILFTAIITKTISVISEIWRKGLKGMKNYNHLKNHTVIFGWQGEITEAMVNYIRQDKDISEHGIVLCTISDMENPLPDYVHFVRADSYSPEMISRTGIKGASRACVYGKDDTETLAIALMVCSLKDPITHVVANFRDSRIANLLTLHHPEVECAPQMVAEVIARSMINPGSSAVISDMLSMDGAAQYSGQLYMKDDNCFENLLNNMRRHELLPVAVQNPSESIVLNPIDSYIVNASAKIWYLSSHHYTNEELTNICEEE